MVLLVGCDNRMPEVNDTNCQIEKIKKIEDRATREKLAGLCLRQSPTESGIAPTEKPMNWLKLVDPKQQQKEVKS